ncbi:pentatricopeptide repeat-containing protein At4g21705, mitochondrial [Sorghum bicolor]|nr:pentatricopeptide repeat-containing protein At4g21705, mitochondrial [Sorghum bicolor]EER90329.1 hypothetical protein SORBI_3010G252100 [Sorghum bicolor]|eukprot:XP_002438962.1 pentatricopeptide repeat-containing protein At4g21705, mitochondrial [Sorghum bicolor]
MASSSLFAAARRLLSIGRRGGLLPVPPSRAVASSSRSNRAEEGTPPARPPTLWSTLCPLGKPGTLLVPEIELWAARSGKRLRPCELHFVVKDLRRRHRHRQALEVSEWMNLKGHVKFLPKDHAVHLDLIGHIHGVGAAETYFNNLSDKDKTEKPYGALLYCYTRECLVDKALAHFQKMKELGFVFTPLPYSNLMILYANVEQHERVPSVMAEMKSNGIVPNNFSYNICINAYGTRADFSGLENTLEEMEFASQVVVDWRTYADVASHYIKGDLREKAYSALQKAEAKMDEKDSFAYSHLISLYGHLGDKSEIKRLWVLQMLKCKGCINKGYKYMLTVLVKLDEIAEAEDLLKKWESSKNEFDFKVPNILLKGYCQWGLLDKAEALLDGFLRKGKKPSATSWAIVASAYAEKGDVPRAYELTKRALSMCVPDSGWIPEPSMIEVILKYLGDEGEVKDVEAFIDLLKVVVPMNSDMTEALSRARSREEKKKAEETTEAPREDSTA